ncbi:nucleotidyltransferase domain-containing protein [Sinorhizobium meliloti]|nr:nucleotidyltransferase domain-containing protein [Sinorhizobium meliloti]
MQTSFNLKTEEIALHAANKLVVSLFICGSAARGDDKPDSDLDLNRSQGQDILFKLVRPSGRGCGTRR